MELMGHKDIKMTQRYAHLLPSIKREAVNRLADGFEATIAMENISKIKAVK
jgi:hypothetical protein